MVKPNINQRAIPVQQNCPGDIFYQVVLLTNQKLLKQNKIKCY